MHTILSSAMIAGLLLSSTTVTAQASPVPVLRELDKRMLPRKLPCETSQAVLIRDFDGDGSQDVLLGGVGAGRLVPSLYLNDGHGGFTDVTATHMPASYQGFTYSVAAGDADGDGDVDVVLGNDWDPDRAWLLLNDGQARFSKAPDGWLPSSMLSNTRAVALADLDGDGDLDYLQAGSPLRLGLNDGTGHFTDVTAMHFAGPYGGSWFIVPADVDGDGDLDLVLTGNGVRILVNDGSARFVDESAARVQPADPYPNKDPQVVDMDGDGDLDIVVASSWIGTLYLYRNDGRGYFQHDPAATPKPSLPGSLEVGDFDEDGDPDVFIGNGIHAGVFNGANQFFENDGSGRLTDATARFLKTVDDGGTLDVASADLDGDGDLDVVLPDGGGGRTPLCYTRVLFNMTRHLYGPLDARIGQDWLLELNGPPGGTGFLIIAAASVRTPLPPFGTFGLHPQAHIVLPAPTSLNSAGVATLRVRLPYDVSLRQRPIYAQVLLLDQAQPMRSRFTNVYHDVIQ